MLKNQTETCTSNKYKRVFEENRFKLILTYSI